MAHVDPTSSKTEEFLGERGPPLFILKDEWETSPPTKEKSYHQLLDPRTRAFMKVAKQAEIEILPVGLVQWKVPHAGPGLNVVKADLGEREPEPDYMIKMAMINADFMGVGGDEEVELDATSSDDEDGILLKKGEGKEEDDGLTVYYPLISMPCRHRGKKLRELLSLADEDSGPTGKFAKEWLDEIKRADKFPCIIKRGM